jgi:UDP-N-acetylglucosamine transferase subunit ALG13
MRKIIDKKSAIKQDNKAFVSHQVKLGKKLKEEGIDEELSKTENILVRGLKSLQYRKVNQKQAEHLLGKMNDFYRK